MISHNVGPVQRNYLPDVMALRRRAGAAAVSRYDKTPESYDVGLHLRASMIWLNDLTRRQSDRDPTQAGSAVATHAAQRVVGDVLGRALA
ncbi:hypothetical protein [Streptomyces sp. NPDC055749]